MPSGYVFSITAILPSTLEPEAFGYAMEGAAIDILQRATQSPKQKRRG